MHTQIQHDVPLRLYTTLKVGGNAEYFVTVSTEESLVEAVAFAKEHDLSIHILGGGSNTLVPDEGVKGLVIHLQLKGMQHEIKEDTVLFSVAAGEVFDDIVAYSVEHNWWGLENLSSIPGSVGATPVQNVGAYGVEIKDVVSSVRVFNTQTERFEERSASDCAFGYRDSLFKHQEGKHYVIVAVTYRLSLNPQPNISYKDLANYFNDGKEVTQKTIREAVMKIRAGKFPDWNVVGTAGSFFKNPVITREAFTQLRTQYPELPGFDTNDGNVKVPLGWVLDKVLGVRGYTKGNISSYKDQALVLVAQQGATAEEIKMFATEIVIRVKEKTNIDVAWEVSVMQ